MGLARLLGKVGKVFGSAPRGRRGGRTGPSPFRTTIVSRAGYLDPGSFVTVVKRMAVTDEGRRARLHVFSLGDFRAAVGGKWGRLERLIEVATDSIIRRHINVRTDVFTHLDAETSLLAMPLVSRQEARVRVAAIARDLAVYLLGDAVIGGRRPQVVAANLPLGQAVAADGTIDAEAVQSAVAKAGAVLVAEPPGPGLTATGLAELHRAGLAALLRDAELVALNDGSPAEAADPAGTPADDPGWLDFHLRRRAEEALAGERPLLPETTLSLVWTPTWLTERQAVAAFHARVLRSDGEGRPLLEGAQAYAGTAPMGALTLDRFATAEATREARDLAFARQQMPLIVPIHWSSLAQRWRGYLLTAIDDCPPATRRKLLKIEVFGLPPTLAPAEIEDLLKPLEPLGCDLLLRLPLAAFDAPLPARGVRAVGIDLAALGEGERVGDDELFARLERCRDAARQAGCGCYLWGVRRRPLIARVARAGLAMVNGPGLMSDVARPYAPAARRAG